MPSSNLGIFRLESVFVIFYFSTSILSDRQGLLSYFMQAIHGVIYPAKECTILLLTELLVLVVVTIYGCPALNAYLFPLLLLAFCHVKL